MSLNDEKSYSPESTDSKDQVIYPLKENSWDSYYEFVSLLIRLKASGREFIRQDSEFLFKKRHDIFETFVLSMFTLPFQSEKSFSEYGLCDSNRTPDIIHTQNKKVFIIEFTTSYRAYRSYINKEGFTKYDREKEMLSKLGFEPVSYYIFCSYDMDLLDLTSQIETLSRDLDMRLDSDFNESCEFFLNEYKRSVEIILLHLQELLEDWSVVKDLNLPKPRFDFKQVHTETKIEPYMNRPRRIILSHLLRKKEALRKQFNARSSKLKLSLSFISFKTTFSLVIDMKGKSVSEWMELLDNPVEMSAHIRFVGDIVFPEIRSTRDLPIRSYRKTEEVNEIDILNRIKNSDCDGIVNYSVSEEIKIIPEKYKSKIDDCRGRPNVIIMEKSSFIIPPTELCIQGDKFFDIKIGDEIFDRCMERSKASVVKVEPYDKLFNHKRLSSISARIKEINTELGFNVLNFKRREFILISNRVELFNEAMSLRNERSQIISTPGRGYFKNKVTFSKDVLEMSVNWGKTGKEVCHPETDLDHLQNLFNNIIESMKNFRVDTTDSLICDTEPVALDSYTIEMFQEVCEVNEEFRRLNLAHCLQFYHRMAYSLTYYSNCSSNKNDVFYDNLGYSNCMLMVKGGGSKMMNSNYSRLFRVFIPVNSSVYKLSKSKTNKQIFYDNNYYIMTGWRQIKIDLVKKYHELFYQYYSLYYDLRVNKRMSSNQIIDFTSVKILNMFNQKRRVESWFSNLRYIYFNSLGIRSKMSDTVSDMAVIDFDPYIYMMQRLFIRNFLNVYNSIISSEVFCIFKEQVVSKKDLLFCKLDEHLFMVKAAVNINLEKRENFKKFLEIHNEFLEISGGGNDYLAQTSSDDPSECAVNDFMFSPKLCQAVGSYASKLIRELVGKETLSSIFDKIITDSYTSIKTARGMRLDGVDRGKGKKGNQIILDSFQTSVVLDVVQTLKEDASKFKKLEAKYEKSFLDAIKECLDGPLIFDFQSKIQYKGSREIYVMSHNTKVKQQPIEKFLKVLCRYLPNELVNVSSDVRPKIIHSKVKMKEEGKVRIFATMDCSKWATKNNIFKYWYMYQGLKDCLPRNFCDYFEFYWPKMFEKIVMVDFKTVRDLRNNPKTRDLLNFDSERIDKLIEDDKMLEEEYTSSINGVIDKKMRQKLKNVMYKSKVSYVDFKIPYSFLMGMFGYLSSFLHAASQLYFIDKFGPVYGVSSTFIAHSDDSAGVMIAKDENSILKFFSKYQTFQKMLNHKLSMKKSNLSYVGFEMISIMYINESITPLTHKFLTNVSYEPTMQGWRSDISKGVSIVNDIFSNGGCLNSCYNTFMSYQELVRKIYHLPKTRDMNIISVDFGGTLNVNPLLLLIFGVRSSELVSDICMDEECYYIKKNLGDIFGGYIPGYGCNVECWNPLYKAFEKDVDLDNESRRIVKSLSLWNNKTTLSDFVSLFDSLHDFSFYSGLLNIDTNKFYQACMISKSKVFRYVGNDDSKKKEIVAMADLRKIIPKLVIDYTKVRDLRLSHQKTPDHKFVYELYSLGLKYSEFDHETKIQMKPITFDMERYNLGFLTTEQINRMTAYNIFPDICKIDALPNKIPTLHRYLMHKIDDVDAFLKILMYEKNRKAYKNATVRQPYSSNNRNLGDSTASILMYSTKEGYTSRRNIRFQHVDFCRNFFEKDNEHLFYAIKMLKYCEFNKIRETFKCCSSEYFDSLEDIVKNPGIPHNWNGPFAIYKTRQYKSELRWTGDCEFDLYCYGSLYQHRIIDGVVRLTLSTLSSSLINVSYPIYETFCQTRDIRLPDRNYEMVGYSYPKIVLEEGSFRLSTPGEEAYVFVNSRVFETEVYTPPIHYFEGTFYHDDEVCDLEIIYREHISPAFYKNHNMRILKHVIFLNKAEVDIETFFENFETRKICRIMSLDPSNSTGSDFYKKYYRTGYLGCESSFTRACAIADDRGIISYNYSGSPKFKDITPFEKMTFRGIPILDMFSKVNLSRLTWKEVSVLQSVATGEVNDDVINKLEKIREKIGLKSTEGSIVIFSLIAQNMCAGDIAELPISIQEEMVICWIKAIESAYPKNEIITKKEIFNMINFYTQTRDYINFSRFLADCLKKSLVNTFLFKKQIDANFMTQSMIYNSKNDNLRMCISACLHTLVTKKSKEEYVDIFKKVRSYNLSETEIQFLDSERAEELFELCKYKNIKIDVGLAEILVDGELKDAIEFEIPEDDDEENYEFTDYVDIINERNFEMGEPVTMNNIGLDLLGGGDLFEDLEEDDIKVSNIKERKFDGPEITYYSRDIESDRNFIGITSRFDFSKITIYSVNHPMLIPWLGNCKLEVSDDNIYKYKISYPGEDEIDLKDFLNKPEIPKRLNLKELTRIEVDEEEEKKKILKRDEEEKIMSNEYRGRTLKKIKEIMISCGLPFAEREFLRRGVQPLIDEDMLKILGDVMSRLETSVENIILKRKKNDMIYEGFNKIMSDPQLEAELRHIFGSHYQDIVRGNFSMTKVTYDFVLNSIISRIKSDDNNRNMVLCFLCSVLKDSIAGETTDSWFLDAVLNVLDRYKIERKDVVLYFPGYVVNDDDVKFSIDIEKGYESN